MSQRPKDAGSRFEKAVFLGKLLFFREIGVITALALIFIFFSMLAPPFASLKNVFNILRQASEIGIIAVSACVLITSGEFDLSVGSVYGLSGVLMALMIKEMGIDAWIALLVGLLVATGVGLYNGLVTTKVHIPSFITTLGSMMIFRGLTLVISHGWPIAGLPESSLYGVFGRVRLGMLPVPVLWLALFSLICWYLLHQTAFGIKVLAVGGNPEAARYSGIPNDKIKTICFTMTSLSAGLASVVSLSFLQSVTPTQGSGLELEVIAASVIGGTSLRGGSGSVLGAVLGALIMAVIRNGLVMVGTGAYWQDALIGMILVLAVTLNAQLERRRSTRV